MPYLLNEDGVIVEDLDGVSWTDVVKQKRALAASARRYAELDAAPDLDSFLDQREDVPVPVTPGVSGAASELVKIEIGKENEALTASLMERMEQMSQREAETQMALVAALHAIGTRESVVNVQSPNVNVEPAAITVEQPDITVHPPEVKVEAPNVTVNPMVMPQAEAKKTVTFTRDFSGRIEGAEIAEE